MIKIVEFKTDFESKMEDFADKVFYPFENFLFKMKMKEQQRLKGMSQKESNRMYSKASGRIIQRIYKELYEDKKYDKHAMKELLVGTRKYSENCSETAKNLADFLTLEESSKYEFIFVGDHFEDFNEYLSKTIEECGHFNTFRRYVSQDVYVLEIKLA